MQSLKYQVVQTRNGQVGYCQVGSGPPIILIVGYSGTLYHWNHRFISKLAEVFSVHLLDNRKIGLSDSQNEYSMAGMAQDVVDFITAKDLFKPYLLGWSMGGIITQTILKFTSELIGGAVLLATVPHPNHTNPAFVNLLAQSVVMPANEFRKQLYGMFFSQEPQEGLKNLITDSALSISEYHYRFNFDAKELQDYAIVTWPGMDNLELAKIEQPVLVLRARNDWVVASTASDILAENIPGAKLIVYPDGGHFFLHTNPLMIARDVINFFT